MLTRSLILASCAPLLAVLPVTAASPDASPTAAVETASAAGLEIEIRRPFESARLVIRRIGGAVVHRGTYTATPIQLFPRLSDEGEALEDGAYVYELLVYPPAGAEPSPRTGPGDGEAPGPVAASDVFELQGGNLVPREETPAEDSGGSAGPAGNRIQLRDSVVFDDLVVEGSSARPTATSAKTGRRF